MNQTTVIGVVCEPTLVPEYYSSDTTVPGPELTIIVPTRNEHDNILPVYHALCRTLRGVEWEAIFVDDDSEDGTPESVRRLANDDRRVRCIQRIGRRGLASACVEGILASSARYVAVMDADLQHDERLLPRMLNVLMTEPIDVVVGSRYVEHGSIGTWDRYRAWLSNFATHLGRKLLGITIADPMSGFFIVRREAFQDFSATAVEYRIQDPTRYSRVVPPAAKSKGASLRISRASSGREQVRFADRVGIPYAARRQAGWPRRAHPLRVILASRQPRPSGSSCRFVAMPRTNSIDLCNGPSNCNGRGYGWQLCS